MQAMERTQSPIQSRDVARDAAREVAAVGVVVCMMMALMPEFGREWNGYEMEIICRMKLGRRLLLSLRGRWLIF